jgi:hypothetical protein
MISYYDNGVAKIEWKGNRVINSNQKLRLRVYKTMQRLEGYHYDATFKSSNNSDERVFTYKEKLGMPPVNYINEIEEIRKKLDLLEDKLDNQDRIIIEMPYIDPTGDPYKDLWKWLEEFKMWEPFENIDTSTGTGTGNDTGTGTGTEQKKDDDDDDNRHFHLFPFCIPFDVVDMVKGLRNTPEAPRWEIPIALPAMLASFMGRDAETIVVDLGFLGSIMPFVRLLILAAFIMILAKATSSFIKW